MEKSYKTAEKSILGKNGVSLFKHIYEGISYLVDQIIKYNNDKNLSGK